MALQAPLLFALLLPAGTLLAQQTHDLGEVDFDTSCNRQAQEEIDVGVAQLHHMMYDEARPHFAAAAASDPECAVAHWGTAMTRFQPLWHPTSDQDLERGKAAVEAARSTGTPTGHERGYITAVEAFFSDPEDVAASGAGEHQARVAAWLDAQRALHEAYPEDVDAAAFYALAEVAYAQTESSPQAEPDHSRVLRAGSLLERYLDQHPEHPGLHHYLIHAYDRPELADMAEDVASRYDQLAPQTPHALHMPSHIFVRQGRWAQTADWNERSAEAALSRPVDGVTSLHYAHALDYVMYAYLQLGDEEKAEETLRRVREIEDVQEDFASAYGIAAAQARYHLEQRRWEDAAELAPDTPDALEWENFPAAQAMFHYARGLGAARSGRLEQAERERARIGMLADALRERGDQYWAHLTAASGQAVEAWTLYERGETDRALTLMGEAADLEASVDKHPVTPGEVLPIRELHGELLLRENRPADAYEAFETSLERTPNRRYATEALDRAQVAVAEDQERGQNP